MRRTAAGWQPAGRIYLSGTHADLPPGALLLEHCGPVERAFGHNVHNVDVLGILHEWTGSDYLGWREIARVTAAPWGWRDELLAVARRCLHPDAPDLHAAACRVHAYLLDQFLQLDEPDRAKLAALVELELSATKINAA